MRTLTRIVLALVFAAGVPTGEAAFAQITTGINVTVEDWLPAWDPETGGWGLVAAGGTPLKFKVCSHDALAAVPPGTYDLYWVQDDDHAEAPMAMATGVVVADGAITEIRIASGISIVVADWVPELDADVGFWGATRLDDPDGEYINWVWGPGRAMVLPPGEYDFWWDADDTDAIPAVWIDTVLVGGYGGLGLGFRVDQGAIVIVGAVAGGPAATAGLAAGDVILAVDGRSLDGMDADGVAALLRGALGTSVTMTIARAGTPERLVTVTRQSVLVREFIVGAGIRVTPDPTLPALAATGGWWGVVYAGDPPDDIINRTVETTAPLLVGWDNYDIYWAQDPALPPRLVAANVAATPGEIVEVVVPPANAPRPKRVPAGK